MNYNEEEQTKMQQLEKELSKLEQLYYRRESACHLVEAEMGQARRRTGFWRFRSLFLETDYGTCEIWFEIEGFSIWAEYSRSGSPRWFCLFQGKRLLYGRGPIGKRQEQVYDHSFPWEQGEQDQRLAKAIAEYFSSEEIKRITTKIDNLRSELGIPEKTPGEATPGIK